MNTYVLSSGALNVLMLIALLFLLSSDEKLSTLMHF